MLTLFFPPYFYVFLSRCFPSMYLFSRLPTYSLPRPYFSKLHHHPTKECRLPLLSFFSTFFEVSAFLNFPSAAFCDSLCVGVPLCAFLSLCVLCISVTFPLSLHLSFSPQLPLTFPLHLTLNPSRSNSLSLPWPACRPQGRLARALNFGPQLARCSVSSGQNKAVSHSPQRAFPTPATRPACSPTSIAAPGYAGSPRSPKAKSERCPQRPAAGHAGRAGGPTTQIHPWRGGPANAPKSPAARRRRPRQAPDRLGIGVPGGQGSWETVTGDRRTPPRAPTEARAGCAHTHCPPAGQPGVGIGAPTVYTVLGRPSCCVQIDCKDSLNSCERFDLTSLCLAALLCNDPGNWCQGQ